jgi:hypothetical protein
MHDHPKGASDESAPPTPSEVGRQVERVVLTHLLDAHPDRFTIPEVSRAMNAGKTDFGSEDAVERAIRQLVGAGLLHCCSGFILPTRAALYYSRLAE